MIGEIVSTSKGINPHNFFKTMNNELLDQELNLNELKDVNGSMICICPPWWPRPRFPFPFPFPSPTFPDPKEIFDLRSTRKY